jgi:nucleotidyltransferase DUF2204
VTVLHDDISATLRKAAPALREAGVPFMLGGSFACWARGGPRSQNDLDLMLPTEEAVRALEVLTEAGMRPEQPPEEWLLKAWDGDVMVDLIFDTLGIGPVTREHIDRAERMPVLAIEMPVMSIEDVLVGKLLTLSEQRLDYGPLLEISRALREKVDWPDVRHRIRDSPYARAFFGLLAELDVWPLDQATRRAPT